MKVANRDHMEAKMAKKKDSKSGSMFVFRDGMVADSSYVEWLSDIKQRFRQSQTKASIRVNTEMLEFYWGIGRCSILIE